VTGLKLAFSSSTSFGWPRRTRCKTRSRRKRWAPAALAEEASRSEALWLNLVGGLGVQVAKRVVGDGREMSHAVEALEVGASEIADVAADDTQPGRVVAGSSQPSK